MILRKPNRIARMIGREIRSKRMRATPALVESHPSFGFPRRQLGARAALREARRGWIERNLELDGLGVEVVA